jgi:hypothetical protein
MDTTSPQHSLGRLDEEKFLEEVQACYAEIATLLPMLADQHTQAVVVGALGEEIPAGLGICRMTQTCTPEEALAIIKRIKSGIIQDLPDSAD